MLLLPPPLPCVPPQFYKQALLPADAALAAAGVVHRDSLVMLDVGKPMRPRKMLTVPVRALACSLVTCAAPLPSYVPL